MQKLIFSLLTVLLILGIVPTVVAEDLSGADAELLKQIDEVRRGVEDGLGTQDIEKVTSFAHPEIVVTWQNAEVSRGVKEVEQMLNRMLVGPNSVVKKIVTQPLVVEGRKIIGDTVISYGHMKDHFELRENDMAFDLNSRFSSVLVRENGRYLLRGLHLSANVFDNPIQTLVVKQTKRMTIIVGLLIGAVLGYLLARRGTKKA